MLNIPDSPHPRIVIIGAGFAGFKIAKKLSRKKFQIVLIDKNNYHQFQPLFYQVAMAGLEPSSILYPLRKAFQKNKNVHIRVAEVQAINPLKKRILSSLGEIYYDKCIIATGVVTNFFGNESIEKFASPLKSITDALQLRNSILSDLENALMTTSYEERQGYIDIVIVGGGPTGVELAGALAEMKKYILPKDYPELNEKEVDIYLIQSGKCLLPGMSEMASGKALEFLEKLNVNVILDKRVTDFNGRYVKINDGTEIKAHKVIWAAGVRGESLEGIESNAITKSYRYLVDPTNKIIGYEHIYAIGDIAYMQTVEFPEGHPQVAQVAIQQAVNLANNFIKNQSKPFKYKDLGTLATIGRNKAVADLPKLKFYGFTAWVLWLIVHLRSLIGFKNKFFVMLNWVWNYITYDQSLRLIITTAKKNKEPVD